MTDEDQLLAQALALSMDKNADDDVEMELSEEEQIARAIQMSLGDDNKVVSFIHYSACRG